jgi:3-hydroxyisobutyrate dehydrogenase-like beta-hydroxyacid dehydrogenase
MGFQRIAVIGFGEAGPAFAKGFLTTGASDVRAYDILIDDPARGDAQRRKTAALGVTPAATNAEAVAGAELVLSTVTSDRAADVAAETARTLKPGQVYLDLNSTSPMKKTKAAEYVEKAGASYVDGVAMDTVPNFGHRVPLILSGKTADTLAPRLAAHEMQVEVVGPQVGQAASIKLTRSILIKGIEAIFTEAMLTAEKADVIERVLASLYVTIPNVDWHKVAGYYTSRLAIHGKRRAAEMDSAADMVEALGIEPIVTRAIAARERWSAEVGLVQHFDASLKDPKVSDFLAAVKKAEASR